MARQIVTWCDAHLAKGEQVVGETWTVSLTVPGGKAREFELDVCADCAAPFHGLLTDLQDSARQISGPKSLPSVGSVTSDDRGPGPVSCPLCMASPSTESALNTHLREHHDTTLAEVNGTAKVPCPVDGCGRKLVNGTGRTSHVRTNHREWYDAHPDRSTWPEVPGEAA